ncbi:hypothetical protein MJO28_014032 [Puccinia striiformis f. sp. tritici]|uniref:Uncharacterized protein n=1 Tax=Puccinia striiformis f. sp. tritici TaxID=168172 RepID=A0ACC0DWM3_9BASI|nr:hypothetical protein MJO28_014032 [Puccinia striiformis f. sp. tritici]
MLLVIHGILRSNSPKLMLASGWCRIIIFPFWEKHQQFLNSKNRNLFNLVVKHFISQQNQELNKGEEIQKVIKEELQVIFDQIKNYLLNPLKMVNQPAVIFSWSRFTKYLCRTFGCIYNTVQSCCKTICELKQSSQSQSQYLIPSRYILAI